MIVDAEEYFNRVVDISLSEIQESENITDAWIDKSGLYVETNTVDAVDCRQLAEEIQIRIESNLMKGHQQSSEEGLYLP